MIILSGSDTAVSFTDETSIDARQTNNQKVSVHAEIVREKPYDWFLKILSYFPDVKGELKSNRVVVGYFNLQESERNYINSTLKFARIHIVDPRPYISDVKKAINKILPNKNVDLFLNELSVKQKQAAEELAENLNILAAQNMYFDAPHRKLKFYTESFQRFYGYGYSRFINTGEKDDFEHFDHKPFLNKKGRIRIENLTHYLSKSGSVFMDAIDEAKNAPDMLFSPVSKIKLVKTLSKGRAFDAGNDKALKWIDERRQESIRAADQFSHYRWLLNSQPLESIDSKKSTFIQAADIAAGIAKAVYERFGIVGIVKLFEYTNYNGKRISQNDAELIEQGKFEK